MLVQDLVPLTERHDTFDLYQSITALVLRAARTAQKDPLFVQVEDWHQNIIVARAIGRALHRLMAGLLKQHPVAGLKTCEVEVKSVERMDSISGYFDPEFSTRKARLRLDVPDTMLRRIWQERSLPDAQVIATWAAHELTHMIHNGPLSRIPGSDWSEIADAVRAGQRSGRGWRLFVDGKRFDRWVAANAIARRQVSGDTWRLQRSTDVVGMATRRIEPPARTGDFEGDFQKDYLSRFGEIEAYASQTVNELLTATGGDRVQALRLMKAVLADGAEGSATLTRYLTHLKGSKPLRLYLKKVADILSREKTSDA